jgi:hypothetical protein
MSSVMVTVMRTALGPRFSTRRTQTAVLGMLECATLEGLSHPSGGDVYCSDGEAGLANLHSVSELDTRPPWITGVRSTAPCNHTGPRKLLGRCINVTACTA